MSLHVVCDVAGCGLTVPLDESAGWTTWPDGANPQHRCPDHRDDQ